MTPEELGKMIGLVLLIIAAVLVLALVVVPAS